VATGRSGELPGLRSSGREEGTGSEGHRKKVPVVLQPGFWGGSAESDKRAAAVLARIQNDLGPEEVLAARLQGGRDPSERAFLVPVDSPAVGGASRDQNRQDRRDRHSQDRRDSRDSRDSRGDDGPWPGRLPPPSPAVVLTRPLPVTLADSAGAPVLVSARVLLSAAPAQVSVAQGPFTAVAAWAGPWPADDRWWSPTHRRRARVQVITVDGSAQLLVAEGGGWWLEGVYD
jgi:protein ImuB